MPISSTSWPDMADSIPHLKDSQGRIVRWPKKKVEKQAVLEYLHRQFATDRRYSESEINGIIRQWHCFNDCALLRRELFNHFLMNRTPDGREYWIEPEP